MREKFAPENVETASGTGAALRSAPSSSTHASTWDRQFGPRRQPILRRYKVSRGRQSSIATYWRIDQSDKERLYEIVAAEFDGPFNLGVHSVKPFPHHSSFSGIGWN